MKFSIISKNIHKNKTLNVFNIKEVFLDNITNQICNWILQKKTTSMHLNLRSNNKTHITKKKLILINIYF